MANNSNTNPFAGQFADWTKSFSEFKAPKVDIAQVTAQVKRNAETASTALKIAAESTQAIAQRSAETFRSSAEQAMKASKDLFSQSSPEAAASKQADFLKAQLERNVNATRELFEMSTKSAREIFDLFNKRFNEQVREFSDAASTTTTSKKKAA